MNEKLAAIMKLRKAIEEDLEKMGKLRRRKKTEKERTRFVPKYIKTATLKISQIRNVRDIDAQDYDAPDVSVTSELKKAALKVEVARRIVLQAIIHLLNEENDEVSRLLMDMDDPSILYNAWEAELFSKGMTSSKAFELAVKTAAHPQALLFLSEVLIFQHEIYSHAHKILSVYANETDDARVKFLLAMYSGDKKEAGDRLSEMVRKGMYKSATPLYAFLHLLETGEKSGKIESFRNYLKARKETPCFAAALTYHKVQMGEKKDLCEVTQKYPFCKFACAMKAFEELKEGDMPNIETLDEVSKARLCITIAIAEENESKAGECIEKLLKSFGSFKIALGISTYKDIPFKGLDTLSNLRVPKIIEVHEKFDLLEAMRNYAKSMDISLNNVDFYIFLPNIEYMRLVFGWRVCSRFY